MNTHFSEKARGWLRSAILAPSAHNTQPWLCKIKEEEETLEVYRDPAHTLGAGDPTLRQTMLGIGAFIENLVIAAGHSGYANEVHTPFTPGEGEPVAIIHFREEASETQTNTFLYEAIENRHTNRGKYDPSPIDPEVIANLKSDKEEIEIFPITDPEAISRIADLVGKGITIGLGLPPLKEELAELVSFESEGKNKGLLVETMSEEKVEGTTGKDWLLKDLNVHADAEATKQRYLTAPLLVVIGANQEDIPTWLDSGRVMQRTLLIGAAYGLVHDIAAAPIEVPTITPLLRKEINENYRPEVLIRMGVALNPELSKSSPRRDVNEIICS